VRGRGATSERIRLITAATNHNTRHPMVTAGLHCHAELDQRTLYPWPGPGIAPMQDAFGIDRITTAQMEDFAALVRRLFRGEVIIGHEVRRAPTPSCISTVRSTSICPLPGGLWRQDARSGGRLFDDVVLHTYSLMKRHTLRRHSQERRRGAGRHPDDVKVWSCFATIGDHLPEDARLKKSVGRLGTYLQGYGDLLVRTNGWDPEVLRRFLADPVISGVGEPSTASAHRSNWPMRPVLSTRMARPQRNRVSGSLCRRHTKSVRVGLRRRHSAWLHPDELRPIVEAYRNSDVGAAV